MAPIITPLLLVCIGLGCFVIGTKGFRGGQKASRETGPNTLMHFPAPVPWLRTKVTAARWVMWIGRLYLLAGVASFTGAWLVVSTPPSEPANRNCDRFASALVSILPEALRGGRTHQSEPGAKCTAQVLDQRDIRWFDISSTTSRYAPKNDFLEERRNLSRLSYTIQPIEGLGTRGALAKPKPGSRLNPVLIFNTPQGQHRIEINGREVDEVQIELLIAGLQNTLRTQRNQSL